MSEARKKQQWLIVGVAAAALIVIVVVLGETMNKRQSSAGLTSRPNNVQEQIISDRTSNAAPELQWARQSREEIEALSRQVTELTRSVTALTDQQDRSIAQLREEYDEAIIAQQAEINELRAARGGAHSAPTAQGADASYGQEFVGGDGRRTPLGGSANPGFETPSIATSFQGPEGIRSGYSRSFNLQPRQETETLTETRQTSSNIRNIRRYIPAGSYAPAIVISGADASTGVVSRDNPIPVLVRITGPAITAAGGAGAGRRINVTGCTVLGSAIGDLSAERVYVRLTTLTCIGKNDRVLETQVAGLLAGSGKAGVRGKVVSREGNLATNAAIAGALGGLGEAITGAGRIAASGQTGDTTEALASAGINVAGGGIGRAADRLAEYYIDRAEQYQPVVSLYAGTPVEVVFMEGVELE